MSGLKSHLHDMAAHGGPHCASCLVPVEQCRCDQKGRKAITVSFPAGEMRIEEVETNTHEEQT